MKLTITAAAALFLVGCSAPKPKTSTPKLSLNGEWNIIEANDTTVDTTAMQFNPTIAFDIAKRELGGCAGCNSFTGKMSIDTIKQTIKIDEVAQTLMLCPGIETERRVFSALNDAAGYRQYADTCIALTDAKGRVVMRLQQHNK